MDLDPLVIHLDLLPVVIKNCVFPTLYSTYNRLILLFAILIEQLGHLEIALPEVMLLNKLFYQPYLLEFEAFLI